MFRKKGRNVYTHVLRREQDAKDHAFATAAVCVGFPALMAAFIGLATCNMKKPESESGYVPLEQAINAFPGCNARTEDINGNGKLETVCDDEHGRHFEMKYGPEGNIVLELYACDVDMTKPYKGCR